jgi:putative transposase
MVSILITLFSSIIFSLRTRHELQIETVALRHQINVLRRSVPSRLRHRTWDRVLWVWLSRIWPAWRSALVMVRPQTVIAWHPKGFRLFWTWKCRHCKSERPGMSKNVRELIRTMSNNNSLWGAPRILGELLKLRSNVFQATVAKYMVRHPKPPSQTWRTFLENHCRELVTIDFFTVSTVTFRVLYIFLVLAHDRRKVLHFNATAHPTTEWVCQQLVHAFPYDTMPRYLIRDRDGIFGAQVKQQFLDMGIHEVLIASRSPWQSPYVERLIGSVRRECLDHVIVASAESPRRILRSYFGYYRKSRMHLSLGRDSPEPRATQRPELGRAIALPEVGGLHNRYERQAA